MKKNIITILVLMISAVMFAQYVNVDFEPGSLGAEWGWTVGENGDNPPVTFVANPNGTGINTSSNCAMFTARQGGQPWALCFTDDIDPFEFNASNTNITIMVYKPIISTIAVKFEGISAPVELQSANTLTNQWEEISFNFSGYIGNTYSRLIVIPDFNARTEDHSLYFDNIQLPLSNVDPIPEPATAAPLPMYPSDSVISLFSNAYTNNPVNTWSADWDNANVSDVQIQGDDVKLYTSLVFAGIEFTSSTIDATALDYFHIDMWTPDTITNPEELRIKLVDFGADGVWGADDVEHEISFGDDIIIANSWISLDIPFTDFTALTTRGHLAQLIISGDPNTLYVDNIFFYAGGTVPTGPTVAASTPTAPEAAVISLFSNAYTNVAVDTWSAVWDDANVNDVQVEGDDVKLYTSLVVAGIEFTSQTINAGTMTHFHMDIWTPDAIADTTELRIKLVDFGADGVWSGGDDVEHELTFGDETLSTGTWINLDLPLADFAGLITKEHLAQLIISGDPNTLYIDNIYFYDRPMDVAEETVEVSNAAYRLGSNYPNPFNPETSISYSLSKPGNVTLKVYDLKGRLVETLVDGYRSTGSHIVEWSAANAASGIYFYSLSVNNRHIETRQMVLLK
ncbi:MAG: T9SS type A sorting domain-containing protein [Candidatus Cloacimonetes bacterium]|nr:T9SS type A sorting domain-containing protein [Candidatus Cloacimonadota bacterium]